MPIIPKDGTVAKQGEAAGLTQAAIWQSQPDDWSKGREKKTAGSPRFCQPGVVVVDCSRS